MKAIGIVAAFTAGIVTRLTGKQKHGVSSFIKATNPFEGHHHARGSSRKAGAFGFRARLARYARKLDPKAIKRALEKAQA